MSRRGTTKTTPQDGAPDSPDLDQTARQLADLMRSLAVQLDGLQRQFSALNRAVAGRDDETDTAADADGMMRDALAAVTELHEIRRDQRDTADAAPAPDRDRILDTVRALRTGHAPRTLH